MRPCMPCSLLRSPLCTASLALPGLTLHMQAGCYITSLLTCKKGLMSARMELQGREARAASLNMSLWCLQQRKQQAAESFSAL